MSSQHFSAAIISLILLSACGNLLAQAWDPFPELPPDEHVVVKQSLDGPHFSGLRDCLRGFESKVGASYYAAVVEISAADGSMTESPNAVPYADALYQAWLPGGRLDSDTHVLMVISLFNRGVAIHPGTRWADLGFEGPAVGRVIDSSRFGDLARGGDYGPALCGLASDLDRHLVQLAKRRGSGGVPWGSLLALVMVVAVVLLVLRLRRRKRARQRVEEEIERWQGKISAAAERIFDLEKQYSLYFAAGSRRWSGASQSLDQACADSVNQLFLVYSKAVDLLDDARRRLAGARGLATKPYDEIWNLLRDSPVRFETGEAEERRRIFLPLKREYEGTALTLLDDLDRIYGEAAELLEQVNEMESLQREAMDRVKRVASDALEGGNRRGELGLPTAPLLEELEAAIALQREGEGLLGDPMKAVEVLDRAQKAFVAVEARARLGNEVIDKLRGPLCELGKKARRRVEELRAAGYRLEEPGFQPDVELDRGVREARDVEDLISAGEEKRAAEMLVSLEGALSSLADQLEAIEQARDGVPAALAELESRTREIRQRLPAGREGLERLEAEHSPDAFQAAADNLEELDGLLAEVVRWHGKIREDHQEQRYLSALSALEECEEVIDAGTELLDEIDRAEADLAEARDNARELARENKRLLDEIGQLESRPGLGRDLARAVTETTAETGDLLGQIEAPRPNWLLLESELAAARSDLDGLRASVEEEQAAYERSRSLEKRLGERLRGLERKVESEYRDRPHVGQEVAAAHERFAAWTEELEDAASGGRELLAVGESLAGSLERAEHVWRTEMELVRAAETELRAVRTELRQAQRSHYGYGVTCDCHEARSLISSAEGEAERQRWEDVVSRVRRAKGLIEQEVARCRHRARALEEEARRRTERLRRQRRWEQATNAAVVVGSAMAGRSGSARGPRLPRRRGPSLGPSFGSTFASRGGGIGSRGSSFGGTRSGGSSW